MPAKGDVIVPSLAPVPASTSCNTEGSGTTQAAPVTLGVMCRQPTMVPTTGTNSNSEVSVCTQVVEPNKNCSVVA